MWQFEYDANKSQSNQEKHGINFLEAQELWNDKNILEIPATTQQESRFLVIGKIQDKNWTAVITYRQTKIRIISVRRSRKEEIKWYESPRF